MAEPDTVFAPAPLLRCPSCDFVFLPAVPHENLYDAAYFEDYDGEDYLAAERARRFESGRRLDLLARYLPPPAELLEIGAAAGFFLDEARERGYRGTGLELNDEMASHARATLGLDVRTGPLEEAELGEEAFDAVCAFHVLEHVPAPVDALRRLRAALRPGSVMLIEVPNAASAVARRQGGSWAALKLPHHVGQYGPRAMKALIEAAGLDVVAIDSVPFGYYAGRGPLRAPLRLAVALREIVRGGRPLAPWPHPSGHQLLRAVARRPR